MSLFAPTHYVTGVEAISIEGLKARGIKVILLDRDNTIVPRDTKVAPQSAVDWIDEALANDIHVMFVSNNWAKNVRKEADKFGVEWISKGLKPLPFVFWIALDRLGFSRDEAVVVGDQVFTDVLGARLAGIESILVAPQSETDLAHTLVLRKIEHKVLKGREPLTHLE